MTKLKKKKILIKSKNVKKIKPQKGGKVLIAKPKIQKNKKTVKKIVKKVIIKKHVNPLKFSAGKFRRAKKIVTKKTVKKIIKKLAKKPIKKITKPKFVRAKMIVTKKSEKVIVKKATAPRTIKKHIVHKKSKSQPETGFAAESLFKAKIKVIGVGGGGGSIVSEIGRSLEKATFVIADTDIRALKKRSGMKYLWFGEELTHGLGTGVNVDLAKQAAETAKEKMSAYFKDQDIVIFVASLGGGLGSGATQIFAEAARDFGGITFGIFTMPFKFEGKNKQRIAQNALKSLRKSLNVSLVIPNEKIFKIIDESTPIINAFSTVNKSLIESLESLIDLIYSPGVINIDFADLRTILRGRGNSAFLNTIEASGKNAVENICENIFKNPLLQTGVFKTEKILFNVAGGDALSMFQVEKISSHISDLNPKAKIIFGISKNSKLKNKIKTTILMTGASGESQPEEDVVSPAKPAVKAVEIKKDLPVRVQESVKVAAEKLPIKEKAVKNEKVIVSKEKKEGSVLKIKKPNFFKAKKAIFVTKKEKEKPVLRVLPTAKSPVVKVEASTAEKVTEEQRLIKKDVPAGRQAIRRSGVEIKEAEDLQEQKRIAQEKEWEIPAFLRKVKYKG